MTPSGDRRNISYQSLFIYIALPLIFGVGGFLMRDLYAEVKMVREKKLDKDEFYHVVSQMDKKSDLILQVITAHDERTRK